jgi:glutamine amidotransferase
MNEGIIIENNMPFYDDRYIFIFNGELRGVKIKEQGRIGAEKIFNYIKRFDKGNIIHALQKATEIISKKSAYVKAMNMVLTDENGAYIYSQFNEDAEYFTMYKKVLDELIVVCSEQFTQEADWTPISNNSLMELKCL